MRERRDGDPRRGRLHLCDRFLQQVSTAPDRPALLFDGEWTGYGALERRSRGLALVLGRAGYGPGARIAVLAERRPEVVWSMLAVSRLGGAFIVLDSAYPEARLAALLEICRPHAIVSGAPHLEPIATRLAAARGVPLFSADAPEAGPDAELPALSHDIRDRPAYFLFTSGSTGEPKCVACSHGPLTHFVDWHARTFDLTPSDRFTMLSGLSHDPLLRDVFTPLSIGASLAIPQQHTLTDPAALAPWFDEVGATVTHLTPQMGQVLAAGRSRTSALPRLRRLFWGGDSLLPAHVEAVAALAPEARHVNFYGSTETPQAAAFFEYEGAGPWPTVPVGRGAEGFELLLVDAARGLLRDGDSGEIAVRSAHLSLGYVRAGEVVAPNDRGVDDEGRSHIYYTGDQGRRLADGAILMLGRKDDQVKVRGHRVDLSEVTGALLAHPCVESGVALSVGEGAELRIIAFVHARPGPARGDLAAFLAERLPHPMRPHEIQWLDAIPLLPNGKIDRAALKGAVASPDVTSAEIAAPAHASEVEAALMTSWAAVLGRRDISPQDSFIDLGGDSLSHVEAYLVLEDLLGQAPANWPEISIADLAGQKTQADPTWRAVETSMLVRAVAIVLAVASHVAPALAQTGATTGLFLASGYIFSGLKLEQMFKHRTGKPVLKSVLNVALPTAIVAAILFMGQVFRNRPASIFSILFVNDYIDYGSPWIRALQGDGVQEYLWYVHAFVKILLFVYLAYEVAKRVFGVTLEKRHFLWGLFWIGCATRFAVPVGLDPAVLREGLPEVSVLRYAASSNLATFVLGALLAGGLCARGKLMMLGTTALFAAMSAVVFGLPGGLAAIVYGAALLYCKRISLPRFIAPVVMQLSGASLYIYLTQFIFFKVAGRLTGPPLPLVQIVLAVVGGVVVWRCAAWISAAAAPRLARRAASFSLLPGKP
ncbi:AMP-binding protein [Phenylobacterium sp. LjRoot225]|uniref:AMP-binding protein n=1 Tax=Phenylobacterium sp. LjRoot225 TaxID=3342285 RepID=UPI003F50CA74